MKFARDLQAPPAKKSPARPAARGHGGTFSFFQPIRGRSFVCPTAAGIVLAYMLPRQKKAQIQIKKQHCAA
jgi:hypothetical protein